MEKTQNKEEKISLKNIEQSLLELSELKEGKTEKKSLDFFKKVCCFIGIKVPKRTSLQDFEKLLFNPKNSMQQKNFIAVCLLRLLHYRYEIIWENIKLRDKAFKLFDEQFNETIYHHYKLKKDYHNNEKFSALRDHEKKILDSFEEITNSIVNINSSIRVLQESLMKALRTKPNRIFIEQFISSSLLGKERIGELFEYLIEYQESSKAERLSIFQKIEKLFEDFLKDVKLNNSILATKCLAEPIDKIYNFIKKDFTEDASKPANIKVKKIDRKYPFHITGKKVNLKFILENEGPGYALKVKVKIQPTDGLVIRNSIINFGDLEQGKSEIIFEAEIKNATDDELVYIEVSWCNFNKKKKKKDFAFELDNQRADIDWDVLKSKRPYSLEAVETESELVGRDEIIQTLYNKLNTEKLESSIIYGQKRVGKTSIAQALKSKLNKNDKYITIFIKVGDLDKNSPKNFVSSLGNEIIAEISERIPVEEIECPTFSGNLCPPMIHFLKKLKKKFPEYKFVIFIDEFDEIPRELTIADYESVGDTFFHNIRSLSSENQVGFILIGGENMGLIKQSTDRLNKFDTQRVDYFDKNKYWYDFQKLVRLPVGDSIEFNEDAIVELYKMTEGNPFFTKLICGKIYERVCSNRNAYVSPDEVKEEIIQTLSIIDVNNVNHFWKDGIKSDKPEEKDNIDTQRRLFLIEYAKLKRRQQEVGLSDLENSGVLSAKVSLSEVIQSFISRGILVENGGYKLKPKLFEKWLIEKGSKTMSSDFLDKDAVLGMQEKEDAAYVRDEEIVEIVKKWGVFRAAQITSQEVRAWLNQFGNNIEARLMFKLLKHLKFYNDATVREKFQIIHNNAKKGIVQEIQEGERNRGDILLSSFGQLNKSGPSFARLYAQVNKIYVHNVIKPEEISKRIKNDKKVKAIVFIDDFIASGETMQGFLAELGREKGTLLREKNIKIVLAAVCGLEKGIKLLESEIKKTSFRTEIEVADYLHESDICFSESSEVFNPEERREAQMIAKKYGQNLEKKHPLGYENSQALVVFFDNCPNNTLPIIWASSKGKFKWTPLFRRC